MQKVTTVSNFVLDDEINFFIDLINEFEQTHNDKFGIWQDGNRIALAFGNVENDLKSEIFALPDLKIFGSREANIRSLLSRIILEIKNKNNVSEDLYTVSFWLAKQYPGAFIPEHKDTDNGINEHFEYSIILYLNTLVSGGELFFPSLQQRVKPLAGDLVYFPTRETGTHFVESIPEERYSLVIWLTKDKSYEL